MAVAYGRFIRGESRRGSRTGQQKRESCFATARGARQDQRPSLDKMRDELDAPDVVSASRPFEGFGARSSASRWLRIETSLSAITIFLGLVVLHLVYKMRDASAN